MLERHDNKQRDINMYTLELVFCVVEGENAIHNENSTLPFDDVSVGDTTMKAAAEKYNVGVAVAVFEGDSGGHPDFLITGEKQAVRDFVTFLVFDIETEKQAKTENPEEWHALDFEFLLDREIADAQEVEKALSTAQLIIRK